jgi:hypothetical protein
MSTFTAEMLDQVTGSLQEFEALSDEEFVAFFEPPSLDDRIVTDYALFSVMSRPDSRLDAWLEKWPELYSRTDPLRGQKLRRGQIYFGPSRTRSCC